MYKCYIEYDDSHMFKETFWKVHIYVKIHQNLKWKNENESWATYKKHGGDGFGFQKFKLS